MLYLRNDILVHYGVKGMLWRKGKKGKPVPTGMAGVRGSAATTNSNVNNARSKIQAQREADQAKAAAETKAPESAIAKHRDAKKKEASKISDAYREKIKKQFAGVDPGRTVKPNHSYDKITEKKKQTPQYNDKVQQPDKVNMERTLKARLRQNTGNAVKKTTETKASTSTKKSKSSGSSGSSGERHNTVGDFRTKSSGGSQSKSPRGYEDYRKNKGRK